MDHGRQQTTRATAGLPDPTKDRARNDRILAVNDAAEGMLYRMHIETALSRDQRLGAQSADAADYVAEAFLRVLRQVRQGGCPEFSFAPYLFAVAHNLAINASTPEAARQRGLGPDHGGR